MTNISQCYGETFMELGLSPQCFSHCVQVFHDNPLLIKTLENPTVNEEEKYNIIDIIFEKEIQNFLKVMVKRGHLSYIFQAFSSFHNLYLKKENIVEATLTYVVLPDKEALEKIKEEIANKYNASEVFLQLNEDKSILGGCILKIGNKTYDKSILTMLKDLKRHLKKR